MNLKDSLKELSAGNGKVLTDIATKIEELQIEEYILNFQLIKNTLEKIISDNSIPDLIIYINKGFCEKGLYFSSQVSLLDGADESPNLKENVKNMSLMLTIALDGVYVKTDKWLGDDKYELMIEPNKPLATKLEDWFLSKQLKSLYQKVTLETKFNDKEEKTIKSKKYKI